MVDAGAALGRCESLLWRWCGSGRSDPRHRAELPRGCARRRQPPLRRLTAVAPRQSSPRRPGPTPARISSGYFLYPLHPTDTTSLVQTRTRHAPPQHKAPPTLRRRRSFAAPPSSPAASPAPAASRRARRRRRRGRRRRAGGWLQRSTAASSGGLVVGASSVMLVRTPSSEPSRGYEPKWTVWWAATTSFKPGDERELLDAEEELALGGGGGAAEEVLADDAELSREGTGRRGERCGVARACGLEEGARRRLAPSRGRGGGRPAGRRRSRTAESATTPPHSAAGGGARRAARCSSW